MQRGSGVGHYRTLQTINCKVLLEQGYVFLGNSAEFSRLFFRIALCLFYLRFNVGSCLWTDRELYPCCEQNSINCEVENWNV
jgi:hypothetical protein